MTRNDGARNYGSRLFGDWLRERRQQLGLTQEQVAAGSACTRETISKIELGMRRPSSEILTLLTKTLSIPEGEWSTFVDFTSGAAPPGGLYTSRDPVHAQTVRAGNLLRPITPLIGREAQIESLLACLRQPSVHLLTLTGPPGVGKTRLALELGAQLLPYFSHGVWLVELAPVREADLVLSSIASQLRVRDAYGQPPGEGLLAYLRDRDLLLILDNFEQIVEAAPHVSSLLGNCPSVKILVTSRISLSVRGEHEYQVSPLTLPRVGNGWAPLLEDLEQFEATRLFVERVMQVSPGWDLRNEHAGAIAEICVRLDGLPLAIELAAARAKVFPPKSFAAHLNSPTARDAGPLALLTGGLRDLPLRHQTLRDAIGWSYDLLDPGEKMLFRRMSPFVGGCTLDALNAVCNCDERGPQGMVEGIASLINSSLLLRREGRDGEPRFSMLETIHEYACERLEESGESEELRRQHALYVVEMAERAEEHLWGGELLPWLDRLSDEHDNVRAALRWSISNGEIDRALRICGALWQFWYVRGHLREANRWIDEALAVSRAGTGTAAHSAWDAFAMDGISKHALAKVLNVKGLVINQADLADPRGEAKALLSHSLELFRETGDLAWTAEVLMNLGLTARGRGDAAEATALLEESMRIRRALGDKVGVANCLTNLSGVTLDQGDYSRTESLIEEGLALRLEAGDTRGIYRSYMRLSHLGLVQGDATRVSSLLREALPLVQRFEDRESLTWCFEMFAALAAHSGECKRAATLFGASYATGQAAGISGEADRYASLNEAAKTRLNRQQWERAWAEGRAMTQDESVEYALEWWRS